jgi:hypothetical protein
MVDGTRQTLSDSLVQETVCAASVLSPDEARDPAVQTTDRDRFETQVGKNFPCGGRIELLRPNQQFVAHGERLPPVTALEDVELNEVRPPIPALLKLTQQPPPELMVRAQATPRLCHHVDIKAISDLCHKCCHALNVAAPLPNVNADEIPVSGP